MEIGVIDYGAGNLRSVQKAFLSLGADARIIDSAEGVKRAKALALPGVGAFDDCANALKNMGIIPAIKEAIAQKKPFLGICVGYQILFERSEEFESVAPGLGLFEGSVESFDPATGVKIPQIGWNTASQIGDCPLFKGIPDETFFYFVHSYFPKPQDPSIAAARTTYGETFTSAIWRDNLFATQFHPEKSQKFGLKLLQNFLDFANSN